ncbi:MAG: hypothetical protein MJZ26_04685 [Fibrobacter sp.]|nr:hypothetical protein [Fibrobacter sp.]
MPFELLEEKIRTIPAEYEQEIEAFLDSILLRIAQNEKASSKRKFGMAKGELRYPDNIDSCNDEIAEMFGVN